MNTILFISTLILFVSSVVLVFVLIKANRKTKKIKNELNKIKENFNNLNDNINKIKNYINPDTGRNGYYSGSTIILSKEEKAAGEKGEKYDYIVYVKELDKYTNGESKIQLSNIEVISGFESEQIDWLKTCINKKFCSIIKTSAVTWLESEETVKEMRKQKLEKLENALKD